MEDLKLEDLFPFFCAAYHAKKKVFQRVYHLRDFWLSTLAWHAFAVTSGGVSGAKAGLSAAPT